jgi:hypothetical protein
MKGAFHASSMRISEAIGRVIRLIICGVLLAVSYFAFQATVGGIRKGRIHYVDHWGHGNTIYRAQSPGEFRFRIFLSLCGGAFLVCISVAVIVNAVRPNGNGMHRLGESMVSLFSKLLGGSRHAEREEAVRLGISVSDVERDLPEFGRGNKSCKLVRGPCVKYSLPRQGEGSRSPWSLLQRTRHEGAQLPNGYRLQGDVSDDLRRALTKLAKEFSEEYFEFEGTATDVSVFWEEWGGDDRVQRLHQVLQTLAGL